MTLSPEIIIFAAFAVLAVISALGVVAIRDPVKGAMSLILCFFCISCLFLLQRAELIAVLEVLVYAGAIMVLFVFVIMLVENKNAPVIAPVLGQRLALPVKVLAVGIVVASIVLLIWRSAPPPAEQLPEGFGTVATVGREFFESFLFHFELTSILLLVGIVGAVVVSKRKDS